MLKKKKNQWSTYVLYKSISEQLLSTYHWARVSRESSSLIYFTALKGRTNCEKIDKPTSLSPWHLSLFCSSQLHNVSISQRYMEQNVKHSIDKYPSAIYLSRRALFHINCFNLPRNLSVGYIQQNWTGLASSTSWGKWRARCIIILKKASGNIISILHKITTMSSFIWFKTSNFNVREHKSLKNKHNSINVVRILSLKYPRIATRSKRCKSTWQS